MQQTFTVGDRVAFNHAFMTFIGHPSADPKMVEEYRAAVGSVVASREIIVDVKWDKAITGLPQTMTVAVMNLDVLHVEDEGFSPSDLIEDFNQRYIDEYEPTVEVTAEGHKIYMVDAKPWHRGWSMNGGDREAVWFVHGHEYVFDGYQKVTYLGRFLDNIGTKDDGSDNWVMAPLFDIGMCHPDDVSNEEENGLVPCNLCEAMIKPSEATWVETTWLDKRGPDQPECDACTHYDDEPDGDEIISCSHCGGSLSRSKAVWREGDSGNGEILRFPYHANCVDPDPNCSPFD
jgi:hypothetical protein